MAKRKKTTASKSKKSKSAPSPSGAKKTSTTSHVATLRQVIDNADNSLANLPTADDPYPYDKNMKGSEYKDLLVKLQIELLKVQQWTKARGKKIVVLFEGRDAAGKGGTIKRFTEHLNPRGARVVALNKPSDTERGQWYFQRYIAHLPTDGEIVFFDRSWYNRAGVEPVMGFCSPSQYLQFMRQAPSFERTLVDSHVRLFKLWFDVGRQEQQKRMAARKNDPLKQWKLSPMDAASMEKWDEYTKARDSMFFYTDIHEAPWIVIRSDDKRRARINAILTVLNLLPYDDKDESVVHKPDPLVTGLASRMFPMEGRLVFNVMRT